MTYSSKVDNETISFVEAGPSQGDFCGSYNSPALDMQKPPGTQIISNNMIKSRSDTTCLNRKQSSKLYFSLISGNLPFCWEARKEEVYAVRGKPELYTVLIVLTTDQTDMGNISASELSGLCPYLQEGLSPSFKGVSYEWGKGKHLLLHHSEDVVILNHLFRTKVSTLSNKDWARAEEYAVLYRFSQLKSQLSVTVTKTVSKLF